MSVGDIVSQVFALRKFWYRTVSTGESCSAVCILLHNNKAIESELHSICVSMFCFVYVCSVATETEQLCPCVVTLCGKTSNKRNIGLAV